MARPIASSPLLLPFGTLLLAVAATIASASEKVDTPFSYSGATGPEKWGSLSPKYAACSSGKLQSPIDIQTNATVSNTTLKALARDYKTEVNATIFNNGASIGVTFAEEVGVLIVDGKNFSLKQMHWHSPAEHTIDGQNFAAELHLVHKAADDSISVVGILYQYGDNEDTFLAEMKDGLRELANEKCVEGEECDVPLGPVATKDIRKDTSKYYRYIGSLTIPPCHEDVVWHILGKVRNITKEQVAALKAPLEEGLHNNARPAQPLHHREVQLWNDGN